MAKKKKKSKESKSPGANSPVERPREPPSLRGLLNLKKSSGGFPLSPHRTFPYVGVSAEDMRSSRLNAGEKVAIVQQSGTDSPELLFVGVLWPLASVNPREIILQGGNHTLLNPRNAGFGGEAVKVMPLGMVQGLQIRPAASLSLRPLSYGDAEADGVGGRAWMAQKKAVVAAVAKTSLFGALVRGEDRFRMSLGLQEVELEVVSVAAACAQALDAEAVDAEAVDAEALDAEALDAEASDATRSSERQALCVYSVGRDTEVRIADADSEERAAGSKAEEHEGVDQGEEASWSAIGGLAAQIDLIREVIEWPLKRAEIFEEFGVRAPRGVLLHGPPGTGKSSLAKAAAKSCGSHVITVSGPDVIGKFVGESEANVSRLFRDAHANSPSLIVIDEIDALCPSRRTATSEAQARLTSTFLALFDGVEERSKVFVLATTNRPNALDPALRRPGRLDREIEIGVPNAQARFEILMALQRRAEFAAPRRLSIDEGLLREVAADSHGYVGADLHLVMKQAVLSALREAKGRVDEDAETALRLTAANFGSALASTAPSCLREVTIHVPSTSWGDVGGMDSVKQSLQEVVEWPRKYADTFAKLGITAPRGVLLYGPPGCSKTLMARALAHEANCNFLAVKGPELLSKFLGESEGNMHVLFRRARLSAPSMIFFDEIDAIATARSGMLGGDAPSHDSKSSERMLTQLLHEMDGIHARVGVTVVAATNRPDVLDPALMRPGRLDRLVYVPPPDAASRKAIFDLNLHGLEIQTSESGGHVKWVKGQHENANETSLLDSLAAKSAGFSGAECVAVVQEAAYEAISQDRNAKAITRAQLEASADATVPQITPAMRSFYESFQGSTTNTGATSSMPSSQTAADAGRPASESTEAGAEHLEAALDAMKISAS